MRASLLAVLTARGMVPTAAQRRRIDGCADPAQLSHWLAQAAVAKTLRAALA